jgi:hypothetical protein
MAEIVNLRRARKQRDRLAAEKQAGQNRLSFGRSRAERALSEAERDKADRHVDGHRRDRPDSEPET